LQQKEDKIRVYVLARELNMESKDLLDMCRQHGMDVKNQLSSLSPEQRDAIVQFARRGGGGTAVAAPPKPAVVHPPKITPTKVPDLPRRVARPEADTAVRSPAVATPLSHPAPEPAPSVPAAVHPAHEPAAVSAPAVQAPAEPARTATAAAPPAEAKPVEATPEVQAPPAESQPVTAPASTTAAPEPVAPAAAGAPPQAPSTPPAEPPPPRVVPAGLGANKPMRDLSSPSRTEGGGPRTRRDRPPIRPSSGRGPVAPPPLRAPRPVEEKKPPPQPVGPKKLLDLPDEVKRGERSITINELLKPKPPAGAPSSPTAAPPVVDDEEEGDSKKGGKPRPGAVPGRQDRHKNRAARAGAKKGRENEAVTGSKLTAVLEDDEPRHRHMKLDRLKRRERKKDTEPRKGKVPIEVPITVRALCEAVGIRSIDLLFKLREHGLANPTINSTLEPDLAEAIALENGCELDIKRPLDAEEQLLASLEQPDTEGDLQPRAPIVTVMGHVDHGKTSLLDKIRSSNVVDTEAGGITQVIRAWRVEHNGQPITFLDTPGHEAFTKMRARGANVTDIAVIVVAADDGVMPQTEEAISHAKAAGVSMVVAINKVDLPSANVERTKRQLYTLGVLPDNMGGDTPFVETSAASGKGIDDLLEAILLVAELKELSANPTKPAHGTVLEAMLSEGEGVLATLLIQNGTLHRGDAILCGASYGRVRALYNDQGQPIQEAGPSVPVRITGLDEVPNADDAFQAVAELTNARDIAEKRKLKQHVASLPVNEPVRLENLNAAKIAELKVILKADFRGSIEAIRKELEKLHHEEVRVRILEAAIGAITENDVWLALTSPEDTIIVGFNAVPDERALALAEERGVPIREYDIIYKLTEDIRSALEGKLKPREEVIHLGRASVRETFKISRVGTIAGCYVTQGTIERSSKVRVIRNGVVVYPPADRTASLESLKRFKNDVREVAQGFECGIKIAGYDDVKVDDVVEAYRIEHVQRKLS
jgi:translation initiation factor IF-2